MDKIKNVILCGFGAIGSIYADKLIDADCDFRVLVDESRHKKYLQNPIRYNGKVLNAKYLLPDVQGYTADLIIIATKMTGLDAALNQIENFVGDNTVIIPLLNGVNSEQIVADKYGREKVLYSYFIGHSAVRVGNNITHSGVNTIVFGSDNKNDINNVLEVKRFFDSVGINSQVSEDIKHSLWLKFMLNVAANQTTALFRMTFGEMLNNKAEMELAIKIMKEVQAIAKAEGVNNTETMIDETIENLSKMSPEGKTSMLQDVEAGRETEVDIFAGAVVALGKKHNIPTPYCSFMKDAFAVIYEQSKSQKSSGL